MKKDETGAELRMEKVADLYKGMSIWLVDIERCREQDKNARVMDKQTFDRLKMNIEQDQRLESLPLGYIKANPSGNLEFHIISGHHRVRASRSANIKEIYVLVMEEDLTYDEIVAKQLAHNAIAGEDDKQVLKELYESIRDVDERIKSGVRDIDFKDGRFRNVKVDDIALDFEFRTLKVIFLSHQINKFDAVINEIQADDKVYLAPMEEFEKLSATIREVSGREDIRNAASILDRMCEIVKNYYKGLDEPTIDGELDDK